MAGETNRGSDDAVRSRNDEAPSDGSLLRNYRAGDEEAATQLYLRYAERLRALIRAQVSHDLAARVDHDDILQSAFGSIFRGIKQGSYQVPAGKELWQLFFTITVNKVRAKGAYHRAAKRGVGQTSGGEAIEHAGELFGSDDQTLAFLTLLLEEALQRLAPEQEKAIRLRLEGYEVAEIAKALVRSKRTVERLLEDGRNHLAVLLDNDVP